MNGRNRLRLLLSMTLGIAAIGIATWWLWPGAPGSGSEIEVRASTVPERAENPPTPIATKEHVEEVVAGAMGTRPGEREPRSFLSFRVRAIEDGRLLSGVRLHAWPAATFEVEDDEALLDSLLSLPPRECLEWTTDQDGLIRAEVAPGTYRVVVAEPYFGLISSGRHSAAPEGDDPIVDLWIRAGGAVRGRVVDAAGAPLSGALVWLMQRESFFEVGKPRARTDLFPEFFDPGNVVCGATDPDGQFMLCGVFPREGGTLNVKHPDHAPLVRGDLSVSALATTDVGTLIARPSASIELRILGAPVTGEWSVRCKQVAKSSGPPLHFHRPADSHQATVTGLAAGNYELIVMVPGTTPAKVVVSSLGESEIRSIEVTLVEGAIVRGVVQDAADVPVPEARVRATANRFACTVMTDPTGHFVFSTLPTGKVNLTVSKVGKGSARTSISAPAEDVVLRFERGAVLRGAVKERKGEVPTRVVLSLESWTGTPATHDHGTVEVTPSGDFEVAGLAKGRHRLIGVTSSSAGTTAWIELAENEERNGVDVVLERPIAIEGELIDSVTAQPIAGAWIGVDDPASDPNVAIQSRIRSDWFGVPDIGNGRRCRTHVDGTFRIEGVPSALWRIRASHPSYRTSSWQVLPAPEPDGTARVRLILEPSARLEGILRDASGIPVAQGFVGLFLPSAAEHSPPLRWARTDANGRYSIPIHQAGEYQVRISAGDARKTIEPTIRVDGNGITVRDFDF